MSTWSSDFAFDLLDRWKCYRWSMQTQQEGDYCQKGNFYKIYYV